MSKTTTKKTPKTPRTPAAESTTPTPEEALAVIGEYAREHRNGWRDSLRTLWTGDDDGTPLYAARAIVPAALLDGMAFGPARQPKPLTPEQDAARRLRKVGTAMRAKAKTLQHRAKEMNTLARQLRANEKPEAVAGILRTMIDGGRLAELEAEVAE